MNFQQLIKDNLGHIIAVAIFAILAIAYFSPAMSGKVLSQYDIIQSDMKLKQSRDYYDETGERALWTHSMFSGMPTYMMGLKNDGDYVRWIDDVFTLFLPKPVNYLFLYMLGFYLLLIVLRVNHWGAVFGSVIYGFCSYFFLFVEAGHNTKVHTLAYMAPVIAATILMLRKKYLIGLILFLIFYALQISFKHMQIVYYTYLLVGLIVLIEFIKLAMAKEFVHIAKVVGCLAAATILAFGVNSMRLWTVQEYSKESTRGGKSEMTIGQEKDEKGAGREYAYGWSYGRNETMTLIVPGFSGGGSSYDYSKTDLYNDFLVQLKNAYPGAAQEELEKAANQQVGSLMYWGHISPPGMKASRGTAGPIYLAALLWLFFFIAMFSGKWDTLKIFFFITTVVTLMLCWGRYWPFLSDLFFNYVPYFNKFRVPMMNLTVTQFGVAGMAMMGMKDLLDENIDKKVKLRALEIGLVASALLALLYSSTAIFAVIGLGYIAWAGYSFNKKRDDNPQLWMGVRAGTVVAFLIAKFALITEADFVSFNDSLRELDPQMMDKVIAARKDMLAASVQRTLIFIALGAAVVWLFLTEKLKQAAAFAGILTVISLIDQWGINSKMLSTDDFIETTDLDSYYVMKPADMEILKDQDYYRVLDLDQGVSVNAMISYYHKSVSGYHAAKLQIYQDFMSVILEGERSMLASNRKNGTLDQALAFASGMNMLNTKYVVWNGSNQFTQNPYALGSAWFVNEINNVPVADSAILRIIQPDFDPKNEAIIFPSKRESYPTEYAFEAPTAGDVISLTKYGPNEMSYQSSATGDRFAVFSEVWYRGNTDWNAYIDGKKVDHSRVNYALRGMLIPAGDHEIVFKFEPKAYYKGKQFSSISSLLVWLLIIGAVGFTFYQRRKQGA